MALFAVGIVAFGLNVQIYLAVRYAVVGDPFQVVQWFQSGKSSIVEQQ